MRKFLGLLLLVCSCGSKTEIDPALQPYVDKFQSICPKISISGIDSIKFTDSNPSDVAGRCSYSYVLSYSTYEVKISAVAWAKADEDTRFVTMAHEILHCSRDLEDNNILGDWMDGDIDTPKMIVLNFDRNVRKYCN